MYMVSDDNISMSKLVLVMISILKIFRVVMVTETALSVTETADLFMLRG